MAVSARLAVGVGAAGSATVDDVLALVRSALAEVPGGRPAVMATVRGRAGHQGIAGAARALDVPLLAFPAEELAAVAVPTPSEAVRAAAGTPSVAEAAALAAAGPGGRIAVSKRKSARVTVALARCGAELQGVQDVDVHDDGFEGARGGYGAGQDGGYDGPPALPAPPSGAPAARPAADGGAPDGPGRANGAPRPAPVAPPGPSFPPAATPPALPALPGHSAPDGAGGANLPAVPDAPPLPPAPPRSADPDKPALPRRRRGESGLRGPARSGAGRASVFGGADVFAPKASSARRAPDREPRRDARPDAAAAPPTAGPAASVFTPAPRRPDAPGSPTGPRSPAAPGSSTGPGLGGAEPASGDAGFPGPYPIANPDPPAAGAPSPASPGPGGGHARHARYRGASWERTAALGSAAADDGGYDLRHHGDAEVGEGLVDLAVNVRAGTPPAWLAERIAASLAALAAYPDSRAARHAVAARHGRPDAEVLLTSGAAEAFVLVARALRPRRAVAVHPQFTEPEAALRAAGHAVERLVLSPADGFRLDPSAVPDDADLVLVGNPVNPTSVLHPATALRALARPGRVLVVDEAFMDSVPGERESLAGTRDVPGLLVVRSLTKMWGLAGLRVGYLLGAAELLAPLAEAQPLWAVSAPALAAAEACVSPGALAEAAEAALYTAADRAYLASRLRAVPGAELPVAAPAGPFVLLRLPDADRVREQLREMGYAVRRGDTFPGLGPQWLRIAVRDRRTVDGFLNALATALISSPRS